MKSSFFVTNTSYSAHFTNFKIMYIYKAFFQEAGRPSEEGGKQEGDIGARLNISLIFRQISTIYMYYCCESKYKNFSTKRQSISVRSPENNHIMIKTLTAGIQSIQPSSFE